MQGLATNHDLSSDSKESADIQAAKKREALGKQLLKASIEGNIGEVKGILENGNVDVNFKSNYGDDTPLLCASRGGHAEIVQLLLSQPGIKINYTNIWRETLLIEACENGHTKIIELLPGGDHKIELNLIDNTGRTALDREDRKQFCVNTKSCKLIISKKIEKESLNHRL